MVLFFGGLAGTAHEALLMSPRTDLLLVFTAMMGLPAFMGFDRSRHKDDDEE